MQQVTYTIRLWKTREEYSNSSFMYNDRFINGVFAVVRWGM